MMNFKKITLNDKEWITSLLKASDFSACHQNFGNLFAWACIHHTQVARVYDYLVVKGDSENDNKGYFYPAGKGDIKPIIMEMVQDAAENNHPFIFLGLSPQNIKELNMLFAEKFIYQEARNDFDYVYLLEKMVTLKGKKLHSKRNHINNFKQNNQWAFEQITTDNLNECWEMNEKWCIDQNCKENESLSEENCATKVYFKYFTELGIEGGLIRVDGIIVAYSLGEKLNSDTYVIHIEKAVKDVQGAYTMINREFAALVKEKYPDLIYVNREEDMGLEGLRKSKMSYYPDKMEEKYKAYLVKQ